MVLAPKITKYKKQQKGNRRGLSKKGNFVVFGSYGIQALERGSIKSSQIESCRMVINRFFRRKGRLWIKIFPDKPVTKKPAETRMGKGKGSVDHYVAVVRPGRVLFEVDNVTREEAKMACGIAAGKISCRTRFVERLHEV